MFGTKSNALRRLTAIIVFVAFAASSQLFGQEVDKRYVIALYKDSGQDATLNALSALQGVDEQINVSSGKVVIMRVSEASSLQAVQEQLKDEDVEYIESYWRDLPDHVPPGINQAPAATTLLASHSLLTWGVEKIGANRVWDELKLTGEGVTVAVIDSGFFRSAKITDGNFKVANILDGKNLFGSGPPEDVRANHPSKQGGHGTHVAGTIAGQSGLGVAPDAKIYPIKVFGEQPNGKIQASDAVIFLAIDHAISQNVDVINMSLGSPPDAQRKRVWDQQLSAAKAKNIIVVAATGNGFTSNASLPAASDYAIAVGATDMNDRKPNFSQGFGGASDGVVAPGVDIKSTGPGTQIRPLSGTSMATPHVAGAIALMRQKNRTASREQIMRAFKDTAASGTTNSFSTMGFGRINVFAAIKGLTVVDPPPPVVPSPGVSEAEHKKRMEQLDDIIDRLKKLRDGISSEKPKKENVDDKGNGGLKDKRPGENKDVKVGKEVSESTYHEVRLRTLIRALQSEFEKLQALEEDEKGRKEAADAEAKAADATLTTRKKALAAARVALKAAVLDVDRKQKDWQTNPADAAKDTALQTSLQNRMAKETLATQAETAVTNATGVLTQSMERGHDVNSSLKAAQNKRTEVQEDLLKLEAELKSLTK